MLFRKQNHGQAIVLILIAIVGLIAITALAIDSSSTYADKRSAQTAADDAALAGAYAKIKGQNLTTAALNIVQLNERFSSSWSATVHNPPVADCEGLAFTLPRPEQYVQVIIHTVVDTFFAPIIGRDQLANCVDATARAKPAEIDQFALGQALISLHPEDCRSFWVHGTSDTSVTGGGVFVNSGCDHGAHQAFDQSGAGTITSSSICVAGGATYNGGHVSPDPQEGCGTTMPYPPDWVMPEPECTGSASFSAGVFTPGFVDGGLLHGDITLEGGVYCITGSVSFNAGDHIYGEDVTLYFMDGGLHVNGGAQVNLFAPTTGDLRGLLIYLPLDNSSPVIINGDANTSYTGTILAPASSVQLNGNQAAYGLHSQVIGYTLDLIGNGTLSIMYNSDTSYNLVAPPRIEIVR